MLTLKLPTEHVRHVVQIAREAISNALRHAKASRVAILLKRWKDGVRLTVEDNGAGFNPTQVDHSAHFGLTNMATRAQLIGGALHVLSAAGKGTRIVVDIPQTAP